MRLTGFAGQLQDHLDNQRCVDGGLSIGGVLAVLQFVNQRRGLLIEYDQVPYGLTRLPVGPRVWSSIVLWGEFDVVVVEAAERLLASVCDRRLRHWGARTRHSALETLHEARGHEPYGHQLLVSTDGEPITRPMATVHDEELVDRCLRFLDATDRPTVTMTEAAGLWHQHTMHGLDETGTELWANVPDFVGCERSLRERVGHYSREWLRCAALLACDTLVITPDVLIHAKRILDSNYLDWNLLFNEPVPGIHRSLH